MRWAEALAIERQLGTEGPRWIAARIGALSAAGDHAGVQRFIDIAARYQSLIATGKPST